MGQTCITACFQAPSRPIARDLRAAGNPADNAFIESFNSNSERHV
jgi:hypothetical protein